MEKDKNSINRGGEKKEKFFSNLVAKNPDVLLAKQIMEQARKTQKPSAIIDQSNYYKIPVS